MKRYLTCGTCKEEKSEESFYVCRGSARGRQYCCKACNKAHARANRIKNMARASIETPEESVCSSCKVTKLASEFARNRAVKSGLNAVCRRCDAVESRQRKYGVPEGWLESHLEKINHQCPICLHFLDGGKTPCIDHCHSTGVVRGVLCRRCNAAVGALGDDIAGLERALAYLKSSKIGDL